MSGELFWNLLMRFIFFQIFVLLLDRIRLELAAGSNPKPELRAEILEAPRLSPKKPSQV
jgi:hypothetical protein